MTAKAAETIGEPWRRRLYLPAYQIADAARYSGAAAQTVSSWHNRDSGIGPALPRRRKGQPLSYLELAEVAFVATFRQLGVPLQRIRRARLYAAQVLKAEHPFAERNWLTEGHHLMLDLCQIHNDGPIGGLVVADAHGQTAWQEMVGERFAQFDYESGLALVWHVAGRDSPVVINPRVSFGAPTIRGIPTWALKGRWTAGESIEEMADDFGLDEDDVSMGLNFEGIRAIA